MKIKKVLVILLTIFMIFGISSFSKVNAEGKTCFFIGEVEKYNNGENVSVPIYLENPNSKMATLSLRLAYDESKLEFVNARAGKDLKALLKLAEKVDNESEIAIGAVTMTGFSKSGEYYVVNFKIKDTNIKELPVTLKINETTDSDGNDIDCEVRNNTINFNNVTENKEEKTETKKVPGFEITPEDELKTVEDLIEENTDLQFSSTDNLQYESSDSSLLEVTNEGNMLPKKDGTANVKVKLNGSQISELEVKVENGKVTSVKTLENFEGSDKLPVANLSTGNTSEKSDTDNISKESEVTENTDLENSKSSNNSSNFENSGTKAGTLSVSKGMPKAFYIIITILVVVILIYVVIKVKKSKKAKND